MQVLKTQRVSSCMRFHLVHHCAARPPCSPLCMHAHFVHPCVPRPPCSPRGRQQRQQARAQVATASAGSVHGSTTQTSGWNRHQQPRLGQVVAPALAAAAAAGCAGCFAGKAFVPFAGLSLCWVSHPPRLFAPGGHLRAAALCSPVQCVELLHQGQMPPTPAWSKRSIRAPDNQH
eukprot:1158993-Pelagomonas_calceolata.AAC.6